MHCIYIYIERERLSTLHNISTLSLFFVSLNKNHQELPNRIVCTTTCLLVFAGTFDSTYILLSPFFFLINYFYVPVKDWVYIYYSSTLRNFLFVFFFCDTTSPLSISKPSSTDSIIMSQPAMHHYSSKKCFKER